MVYEKIICLSSKCGYPIEHNPIPIDKIMPENQLITGAKTTISYNSTAEPYIAVNPIFPNKIICVWQQSRIYNGGSLEIGIGYSDDFGKTWSNTVIPIQFSIGGISQRVTDVWVVYNNEGTKAFLNAYYFNSTYNPISKEQQSGIIVIESEDDGKTWTNLKYLISSPYYLNDNSQINPSDDKNMMSIDPSDSNNLYVIWDRFPINSSFHSDTWFTRSTNGGKSWFPSYKIYDATFDLFEQGLSNGERESNQTIGNLVYRLPKLNNNLKNVSGDLLAIIPRTYGPKSSIVQDYLNDSFPVKLTYSDICVIRSKDNGITWDTRSTIITNNGLANCEVYTGGYEYNINGEITGGIGTHLRTGNNYLPMVAINNTNGHIYMVVQSSQLREDLLPQIGFVMSKDGGYSWTPIVRINRTPQNIKNPTAFTPCVAVTESGHIGIMYFDFRFDDGSDPERTKIDGWLAIYKENCCGQIEFEKEIRISDDSWIAQYGPKTSQGVMTNGDYQGIVTVSSIFYCVFTKTSIEPVIPPAVVFEQQIIESQTVVDLDVNPRTNTYVTVVEVI